MSKILANTKKHEWILRIKLHPIQGSNAENFHSLAKHSPDSGKESKTSKGDVGLLSLDVQNLESFGSQVAQTKEVDNKVARLQSKVRVS